MTKEMFRQYITSMMEALISIPDDAWMDTFPTISIRHGTEEAYLGVRDIRDEDVHIRLDDRE